MSIFLTETDRVIVQGMTGSEGRKHTTRMLSAGTKVVAGVNPRKAGTTVAFDVAPIGPGAGEHGRAVQQRLARLVPAKRHRAGQPQRAGELGPEVGVHEVQVAVPRAVHSASSRRTVIGPHVAPGHHTASRIATTP